MTRWLLVAAVLVGAQTARAQPGEHVRLEAETTVPAYLGVRGIAELPARLRLSLAVGYLPALYVRGINEVALAFNGYDQQTADVIEQSLSSSLVLRGQVGWRPFAESGFYFEAGYGLVTLGGGTSEAQVLALVFGFDLPEGDQDRYDVQATLHTLTGEVGWEWWIADRIAIRTALGFLTTLDARTSVEPRGAGIPIVGGLFSNLVENELERVLERYVHTPTISVGIGGRIF